MKKTIITALCMAASTIVSADNVIVTETSTWKSVPITVDAANNTYMVKGSVPSGEYYYTYPGYRCLTVQKTVDGLTPRIFHADGGTEIYCYPE